MPKHGGLRCSAVHTSRVASEAGSLIVHMNVGAGIGQGHPLAPTVTFSGRQVLIWARKSHHMDKTQVDQKRRQRTPR